MLDYPIFYHTEASTAPRGTGRADGLGVEDRTKCAIAFCERVKELGYKPGVYASTTWYRKRVDYLYAACQKNGLTLDQQNRNPSRLSRMPGILRGERRLFVREIHFGTGRHGLLAGFGLHRLGNGLDTGTLRTRRGPGFRHGLLRRRRFSPGHLCRGRSRNGFFRLGFFCRGCFHDGFRLRCCGGLGFRDFGSHFGSYGLHIFSSIADSLLGSRKIRIFSSHLSTRF